MTSFEGKCQFQVRDNILTGRCKVRLPNGQICIVESFGIDLSSLAVRYAGRILEMAPDTDDDSVLMLAASSAASRARYEIGRNLRIRALRTVNESQRQIRLGQMAANLIDAALKGDSQARARIANIASLAHAGDSGGMAAFQILRGVYAFGLRKGVWRARSKTPKPRSRGTRVAGWFYNRPYRGIALDSPALKARVLYTMGMR